MARTRIKLLEQMRANPQGGWSIADIEAVCRRVEGTELRSPSRGSHFKVTHPRAQEILTIPAKRPIKPVYVRKFVVMIDGIIDAQEGSEPSL